jgi:hypothetical protein
MASPRGALMFLGSSFSASSNFAEFLAYFRECREGVVFIQYYLLLTDPEPRFNFGLAGSSWFLSAKRHGHAVWLQTDDGIFRHRPNEGWQQRFALARASTVAWTTNSSVRSDSGATLETRNQLS